MVRHEAPREKTKPMQPGLLYKQLQVELPVLVIAEYGHGPHAASGQVVRASRQDHAGNP